MKKLFLALAVLILPSLALASVPASRSTAQEVQVAPVSNPCADTFSAAVKADMLGKLQEGKTSVLLDSYFGEGLEILQMRGYCAPLEEPIGGEPKGDEVTIASIAQGLVKDLTTQADANGFKVTFVSKITQALGGNVLTVIVTPTPEKVKAEGLDYRILTVFVYNNTRIVGLQLFTTVVGLQQP